MTDGPELDDRGATQRFAVLSILVNHCGQVLTADNVEAIAEEIEAAMRAGPCSWAFAPAPDSLHKVEKRNGEGR